MRAKTKKKHEMGKRFAIVIGVAAAGVMALGAQTAAQTRAPLHEAAVYLDDQASDQCGSGVPGSERA